MVQEIKWTRRAFNDLSDIYDFIAKDSALYAEIQVENIIGAVSNLKSFPLMGRSLPEFPNLPYREILVGNYRVIYRHEGKKLYIMAVNHGRRLLKEPPE